MLGVAIAAALMRPASAQKTRRRRFAQTAQAESLALRSIRPGLRVVQSAKDKGGSGSPLQQQTSNIPTSDPSRPPSSRLAGGRKGAREAEA
jgi:hypothetical protein